jgi:hypothetical protein
MSFLRVPLATSHTIRAQTMSSSSGAPSSRMILALIAGRQNDELAALALVRSGKANVAGIGPAVDCRTCDRPLKEVVEDSLLLRWNLDDKRPVFANIDIRHGVK